MVKRTEVIEVQNKTLEALQALTKGIQKSNDLTDGNNKSMKKLVGAGTLTNTLLKKSQSLLMTVITSVDSVNKAYLGFGRSIDQYAQGMQAAGTTFTEELKASTSMFQAGIRQNTTGVLDMNRKLVILGKNTTVWNKLVAQQTQVMRQEALQTGQMYRDFLDQAMKAGLDTDRLARVLDGVSDTMMKLRAVIGTPGVAMQALVTEIT